MNQILVITVKSHNYYTPLPIIRRGFRLALPIGDIIVDKSKQSSIRELRTARCGMLRATDTTGLPRGYLNPQVPSPLEQALREQVGT